VYVCVCMSLAHVDFLDQLEPLNMLVGSSSRRASPTVQRVAHKLGYTRVRPIVGYSGLANTVQTPANCTPDP